ncbi:hypothetical protein TNCV_1929131 [Trichonephila clavipes]|nr:hypothetical protein TNCV_1929131 [Trichonephila clavipes]
MAAEGDGLVSHQTTPTEVKPFRLKCGSRINSCDLFDGKAGYLPRVVIRNPLAKHDSDEIDVEIVALPPFANELTDGDEGGDEINTGKIIVKDVPGSLEVRSGDSFQSEP